MPKKILFIIIGIITLIFLILFLIFYYLYRRDINIKIQSTSKVEGIVVSYESRNEVPVSLPIVEYSVNGIKYKKKYDYSYFIDISTESKQSNVFDIKYVHGTGQNLDLKTIFPIGSSMIVYYNPKNPEIGFVERFAGLDGYYNIAIKVTIVVYLLITSLLLYLLIFK